MWYEQVRKARSLFAGRVIKLGTARTRHIKWDELDWSKPDSELAREVKRSPASVRNYRMRLNKPTVPNALLWKVHQKVTPEKLASTDWENRRDVDLGREWGVTRERARQIRIEQGAPPCKWSRRRLTSVAVQKWLVQHRELVEGKHYRSIISLIPSALSGESKMKIVKSLGIKYTSGRERTSFLYNNSFIVNWELPNRDIELIWCLGENAAGNHRRKTAQHPPKWDGKRHRFNRSEPEYVKAVQTEVNKAKAAGRPVPDDLVYRITGVQPV